MFKPNLFAKVPRSYDCLFRSKCLGALDRQGKSSAGASWWIANLGGFRMLFNYGEGLVVYHEADVIWVDGNAPWKVEDHEAVEYEDMLDRLLVLDRLADV